MNLVPLPSWLSNVTVPPNASVIRLTTAKPNPCPLDFVVNNGVNNLVFYFFRNAHARVLNCYD